MPGEWLVNLICPELTKVEVFIHLQSVLMLLKSLVALAQDEVVVNLPDKRLVLVNPQLRKEGFSDLGERLPP